MSDTTLPDYVDVHAADLIAGGATEPADVPLLPPVSALPLSRAPYYTRDDPYWEHWRWQSPPSIGPRQTVERYADEDGITSAEITPDVVTPEDDTDGWQRILTSEIAWRVAAALHGYHHLTSKQLSAWCDIGFKHNYRHLRPLWEFGLTERGRYTVSASRRGRLEWFYGLHDGEPIHRWIEDRKTLDGGEQPNPDIDNRKAAGEDVIPRMFGPGTTSNYGHPGAVHVRHNVMTVELLLRLLEVQPEFVEVTSERGSRPRLLTENTDAPRLPADATLWRRDGMRVVIELISSRNMGHVANKMAQWAGYLASVPRNTSGMIVVMLNGHRDRHRWFASELRRLHSEIIQIGTLRKYDGTLAGPEEVNFARQQLHLASWEDWFPEPKRISTLGAGVTSIASPDGRRWLPARLADPEAIPYDGNVYTRPNDVKSLLVPSWAGKPPKHAKPDSDGDTKGDTNTDADAA